MIQQHKNPLLLTCFRLIFEQLNMHGRCFIALPGLVVLSLSLPPRLVSARAALGPGGAARAPQGLAIQQHRVPIADDVDVDIAADTPGAGVGPECGSGEHLSSGAGTCPFLRGSSFAVPLVQGVAHPLVTASHSSAYGSLKDLITHNGDDRIQIHPREASGQRDTSTNPLQTPSNSLRSTLDTYSLPAVNELIRGTSGVGSGQSESETEAFYGLPTELTKELVDPHVIASGDLLADTSMVEANAAVSGSQLVSEFSPKCGTSIRWKPYHVVVLLCELEFALTLISPDPLCTRIFTSIWKLQQTSGSKTPVTVGDLPRLSETHPLLCARALTQLLRLGLCGLTDPYRETNAYITTSSIASVLFPESILVHRALPAFVDPARNSDIVLVTSQQAYEEAQRLKTAVKEYAKSLESEAYHSVEEHLDSMIQIAQLGPDAPVRVTAAEFLDQLIIFSIADSDQFRVRSRASVTEPSALFQTNSFALNHHMFVPECYRVVCELLAAFDGITTVEQVHQRIKAQLISIEKAHAAMTKQHELMQRALIEGSELKRRLNSMDAALLLCLQAYSKASRSVETESSDACTQSEAVDKIKLQILKKVDMMRFVQFCVLHGVMRRVHEYPCLPDIKEGTSSKDSQELSGTGAAEYAFETACRDLIERRRQMKQAQALARQGLASQQSPPKPTDPPESSEALDTSLSIDPPTQLRSSSEAMQPLREQKMQILNLTDQEIWGSDKPGIRSSRNAESSALDTSCEDYDAHVDTTLVAVLTDERPRWAQSRTAAILATPPPPPLPQTNLITESSEAAENAPKQISAMDATPISDDTAHLVDVLTLSADLNLTAAQEQALMLEAVKKAEREYAATKSSESSIEMAQHSGNDKSSAGDIEDRQLAQLIQKSVIDVLPRLLDGTRNMDELSHELGVGYRPLMQLIREHFPQVIWL